MAAKPIPSSLLVQGVWGAWGAPLWPRSLLPARALLLHARLPRELSEFASMKVNSFI